MAKRQRSAKGMLKRPTPIAITKVVGALWTSANRPPSKPVSDRLPSKPLSAKEEKAALKLIGNCVDRAFADAGLDSENEDHWFKLMITLALSIYGPHAPGRPDTWTDLQLVRLYKDIDQLRTERPGKRIGEYCKDLVKKPPYKDMKGGRGAPIVAATLMRRYSAARKVYALHQSAGLEPPMPPDAPTTTHSV